MVNVHNYQMELWVSWPLRSLVTQSAHIHLRLHELGTQREDMKLSMKVGIGRWNWGKFDPKWSKDVFCPGTSWNILERSNHVSRWRMLETARVPEMIWRVTPQWGLFDQATWSYDTFVLLCNVIEMLSIAELHRSITFKSSHGPPSVTPSWSEMVATSSWSRIWKRRSKNFRRHSPTAFASRPVCFWENLAYESV